VCGFGASILSEQAQHCCQIVYGLGRPEMRTRAAMVVPSRGCGGTVV
jgi:hypothetical protein